MPGLDVLWEAADPALLRCLELAHQSFLAHGLPVGSVIVAGGGEQVSEGRNRAYDPAGGIDPLQRTPIAHAEMNALAAVGTGTDLGGMTLWSSHQPCLMCAAACRFTGVGTVVFIAPDPSDDQDAADPRGIETEWVVVANLLFLSGVAAYSGGSSGMIARAAQREPEITRLMRAVGDTALRRPVLADALAAAWPDIRAAAGARRRRRDLPGQCPVHAPHRSLRLVSEMLQAAARPVRVSAPSGRHGEGDVAAGEWFRYRARFRARREAPGRGRDPRQTGWPGPGFSGPAGTGHRLAPR